MHNESGASTDEELPRSLGAVDAICVVVGAIVGVGIFFTPSRVAALAGSGEMALLAWGAGGLVAMLGALTFAELGGMYGRAGGQYEILRDSYGPPVAFVFVFCNATAVQAGAMAVIAVVCVEHLMLGLTSTGLTAGVAQALGLVLIILLTLTNRIGVKAGASIQNATVLAKLVTLVMITILGAWFGGEKDGVVSPVVETSDAGSFSFAILFAAMVPTLFTYGGWQHALWIGGEVKDPKRNVPRSIIVGVTIVVSIYMLVNWGYLRLLGPAGVASTKVVAADSVGSVWPIWGERGVSLAVAFSAFGVLNAQLLSGPRLLYAMARDGRFFRYFGRVHPRHRTPSAAIVLLGVLAIALLIVAGKDGSDRLVNGVVFVDSVFFALTGVAVFVLRKKRPDVERPSRVLFYPVVPFLFVVGEVAVLCGAYVDASTRSAAFLGVIWIGVAAILYALFFRRRLADG